MKQYSRKKIMMLNLSSSVLAFVFNMLIGFVLSPYIVSNLGVEANGYTTLASNFVSYASIVTLALNALGGRFISLYYNKDEKNIANQYYSAVFFSNIIMALIMLIPAGIMVYYLEKFIDIPYELIKDVKLLFVFVFLNFIINTAFSIWETASYVTNRVYLNSIRNVFSYSIQLSILLICFGFFSPHVFYKGLSTLIGTFYIIIFSLHYKKILIPDMKAKLEDFHLKRVIELLSAGIWNSIGKAGQILLNGVDLLITNLFIGATQMGVLSISKTLPTAIINLNSTIITTFLPSLVIDYSSGDIDRIKHSLKEGMNIASFFCTIPLTILIVYGKSFYGLWQPTQDADILYWLSFIACLDLVFTSGMQCLINLFTVYNKLKKFAMIVLASGTGSAICTAILVKYTNGGVFIIAGVSVLFDLIRNLGFVVPESARLLGVKWNTFYPEIMQSVCSVAIASVVGFGLKFVFQPKTWFMLIISVFVTCILIFIVNMYIILDKNTRNDLIETLYKKIRRK